MTDHIVDGLLNPPDVRTGGRKSMIDVWYAELSAEHRAAVDKAVMDSRWTHGALAEFLAEHLGMPSRVSAFRNWRVKRGYRYA